MDNSASSTNLELRVRSLNSPDVSVCVGDDSLVGELKTILADRTSIPEAHQRLIYKGKVLQDDLALGSYHVETGHTLHLVPRQGDHPAEYEGGGGAPSSNDDQRQENGGSAAGRPWGQIPVMMNIPGREGGESQGSDGPRVQPFQPPHLSAILAALGGPVVLGEPRGGPTGQRGAAVLNTIPAQASRVISGLFQGGEHIGNGMLNSQEGQGGTASQGPIVWPPQSQDNSREEEEGSVRRAPRGTGRGELEHIRQGLLTVQTLLQAMRDRALRNGRQEMRSNQNGAIQELPDEERHMDSCEMNTITAQEHILSGVAAAIGTEPPERESQAQDDDAEREVVAEAAAPTPSESLTPAIVPPVRHFFVGQWLDVKDTVNQWLEATVMDIRFPADGNGPSELLIHYNGWPENWDEWIVSNSTRLAPFCTRTTWDIHRANSLNSFGGGPFSGGPGMLLSPMTCYERDNSAPNTGSDDIRVLFPQVARLVSEVLPTMQTVVDNFQQGIVSQNPDDEAGSVGEVRGRGRLMRRTMSWQQHHYQDENVDPIGSELSRETELLAQDLAPLLDRLGRILSDVAPALANAGRDRRRSNGSQGDEEGGSQQSVGSSSNVQSSSSQIDGGISSATSPGHERRVRGRYEVDRRGAGVRLRQSSGRSSGNGEEARSLSPDSAFRRLVHTGGGSIDIHIHAIMPLRPNIAPVAAARPPPVSIAGEGGGQSSPAQAAPNGEGAADEGGGAGGVSSGNLAPAEEGGGRNVYVGGRTTSQTTAGGNSAITSVSGGIGANSSASSSIASPAHGVLFAFPLSGSSLGGQLVEAQQQQRSVNDRPSEPTASAADDDEVENISPDRVVVGGSTEAPHAETINANSPESAALGSHYVSPQQLQTIGSISGVVPVPSPFQNEGVDALPHLDVIADSYMGQNEEALSVPRNESECLNEQEVMTTSLRNASSPVANHSSEHTTKTNVEIQNQYALVDGTGTDAALPETVDENCTETANNVCDLTVDETASYPMASLEEQEQGATAAVGQDAQPPPTSSTFAFSPPLPSSSRWRWIRRGFMRRNDNSGQRG